MRCSSDKGWRGSRRRAIYPLWPAYLNTRGNRERVRRIYTYTEILLFLY